MRSNIFLLLFIGLLLNSSAVSCMKRKRDVAFSADAPDSDEPARKKRKQGSKYDRYYNPETKVYECPKSGCDYWHKKIGGFRNHLSLISGCQGTKQRDSIVSKYEQYYNSEKEKYECDVCVSYLTSNRDSFCRHYLRHLENIGNHKRTGAKRKRGDSDSDEPPKKKRKVEGVESLVFILLSLRSR